MSISRKLRTLALALLLSSTACTPTLVQQGQIERAANEAISRLCNEVWLERRVRDADTRDTRRESFVDNAGRRAVCDGVQ